MIRFFEGFEGINSDADIDAIGFTFGGSRAYLPTGGRFGTHCIRLGINTGGSPGLYYPLINGRIVGDTIIFGFAWKFNVFPASQTVKFHLIRSATAQASVSTPQGTLTVFRMDIQTTGGSNGNVRVMDSAGTVMHTFAMVTDTWMHCEFKVTAKESAAGGMMSFNINGVPILTNAAGDFAGSAAIGNNWLIGWGLGTSEASGQVHLDDLVISDSAGPLNTDMLGDTRILTVTPEADDSNVGWTANMPSGYSSPISTGDRNAIMVISSTATMATSNIDNLIDGSAADNPGTACAWTNAQSDREIRFDFGHPVALNEARWQQSAAQNHGTWKWQRSPDGSNWTDVGGTFTLGAATTQLHTSLNGNTTPARYWRLLQTAGTTNGSPWLREIEFSVYATTELALALNEGTEAGDADLSYAEAEDDADAFLCTVENLPYTPETIFAINVQAKLRKTGNAPWTATLKAIPPQGGAGDTSEVIVGNNYEGVSFISNTNPATGLSWAGAEVNALRIGMEIGAV